MSVFHLKYRPNSISELDSRKAADNLKKILSAKDIPQSFLFAGPKGSGKTSAARILARSLNCESMVDGEPCNKCDNCKAILQGSEMDIIEIDAASNRGIEDVRILKDRAYLMPSKLKRKVFIIDEVHMLTKDAFNALLKLIEEPPKHCFFILCTTDPEKIPETVLSRLVRVDFKKGDKQELKKSLERVIEGEKLEIEDEVISLMVEKSDGSFRNLHRIFNEIYLNLGSKMSIELVEKFLSNGNYNEIDFENDLAGGEIKIILEKLEQMADKGADFGEFEKNLLVYFQNKLLVNFGVVEGEKSLIEVERIEKFIDLLIRAIKQNKDVDIGQLPLELAVIDFLDGAKKNGDNNKDLKENKKSEEKIVVEEKKELVKKTLKKQEKESDETESFNSNNVLIGLKEIESNWGNLLLAVKPFNHSVEAFLRATKPKNVEKGILSLEVFYPFHKDRLEEPKNRKIVEDGMKKVFGVCLKMDCILTKNKKKPLLIDNETPMENISHELADEGNKTKEKNDLYDVAKDIFG